MLRYAFQRLVLAVPVTLGVLVIGFTLLNLVPSDPATVRAGPAASAEVIAQIRTEMGLDRPLWEQFLRYVGNVLTGDLGTSLVNNMSVADELSRAFGATLELVVLCLVWALPTAILLGVLAASRRGTIWDRVIMGGSVAGVSLPVFLIGMILLWVFGYKLQLLPFTGRGGPLWTLDGFRHAVLPSVCLGLIFIGPVARMTRTSMLETLKADHVRTARAKGLSERVVTFRHGLRNALIPVTTLVGLQIGYLLGGAIVTETIFSWPGVGRLAVGAIVANDIPVAQGAIIALSLGFIAMNLIVDLLYAVLDPRVQAK
ncbi:MULTISPECIES: ABC transporter permease [Stappia]|uniref:Peptide/nickel transport system permease protein n=1 Tax=Stappia indica TaxID=538381 RepID=A0A285SW22_9HYPH|nr:MULTISPECIES: ABC transporter permease [Stappia]MBC2857417.1 ABC transporter permease [Stappia sp. 28M-7]MCC4246470.1 ABC transporter permease [Stappia indica]SOC12786.1 peptide/nickel transport system permease protein [Stappia indica]